MGWRVMGLGRGRGGYRDQRLGGIVDGPGGNVEREESRTTYR